MFAARVSFGDQTEHNLEITDPGDADSETRLAWYFEEHLRFPFLDKDLEQQAVDQITAYGQNLFTQVFGGKANHDYQSLREKSFDGCRIEISGSAPFQALHWEALRDPDLPDPLAIRLPVTRRADAVASMFTVPTNAPVLRILVVTARPDGPADIGYRTISRPLLDSLRNAQLPVEVDLVRPGTWKALRAHLRDAKDRHGTGWYQVAHFDLHGSFSDYEELEAGRRSERLLFLPGVSRFAGRRGFLYFETDPTEKAELVPAEDVAALLAEHRLPVAVLNACQSAQQSANEAGLAQRLAEAGVPVTVGMAYSVTVTAAEKAMPALYGKLAAGADPVTAVHSARQELFDHKARQAYFDQHLDLEDWLLPVVFAQQQLTVQLRPMTESEQERFFTRAAAVGDEPATEYGFVGRDLDIQAVEHRVLQGPDTNELLLKGMAGAGKSTLLAHLAWWWQRTGLVDQVFSFSYEERAWTAAQIVREICSRLLSPAAHAAADSMKEPAQLEQLATLLRANRHLLILDNLESVTAAPAAIPHALTEPEQTKLKTLLTRLHAGRTLVLLGSREPETWLTTGTADTYPLPGLDPQASSLLVQKILARHHATHHLADPAERKALNELTKMLRGYPLPLTVVLPVLATLKPSQVLAELQQGGPGADPAGLITRAIEYSHGKLDPALQISLLLLAPFTAVIPTGEMLDIYRQYLEQDEAVKALGPLDLTAALDQAVTVGLAAPHRQVGYLVQAQPVLPYFLRTRLNEQPTLRAATSQAHYQHYTRLAATLADLLTSTGEPGQRASGQAAARAEYANLTTALDHALTTSQPLGALVKALDEYLGQTQKHDTRRLLFEHAITRYRPPATDQHRIELAFLRELAGSAALSQHHLDPAKAHLEAAIGLLEAADDRHRQAALYHQLGWVAQDQRRYGDAETAYHQALDIFLEFGDRHHAAATYHQLGWVAQDQRRYGDAETAYHQALDIFLEFGDRHHAAGTYGQLGNLALDQRQLGDAEAAYRQALDIFLEFGDRHSAAGAYHQLGMVTQDQQRYAEAETAYRQALDIYLEFSDRHSAARTYHQLGMVTQDQQRYAEAETAYRQALDIRRDTDRRAASGTATALGALLAELDRHAEAARPLLYAAVTWHQETDEWSQRDLDLLRQERQALQPAEFTALIAAEVPPELAEELTAAIDHPPEDQ